MYFREKSQKVAQSPPNYQDIGQEVHEEEIPF